MAEALCLVAPIPSFERLELVPGSVPRAWPAHTHAIPSSTHNAGGALAGDPCAVCTSMTQRVRVPQVK